MRKPNHACIAISSLRWCASACSTLWGHTGCVAVEVAQLAVPAEGASPDGVPCLIWCVAAADRLYARAYGGGRG